MLDAFNFINAREIIRIGKVAKKKCQGNTNSLLFATDGWIRINIFFGVFWGVFFWLRHAGSQFPDQGLNPCPLHWEHKILTTGPPGKPLVFEYWKQNKFPQVMIFYYDFCLLESKEEMRQHKKRQSPDGDNTFGVLRSNFQ